LKILLLALPVLAAFLFITLPAIAIVNSGQSPSVASSQQACIAFTDPSGIPAPVLINFDDPTEAAVICEHYKPTFGVTFEDGQLTRAIAYGLEPDKAHSIPNVAINDAIPPGNSEGVPMRITFDEPKTHVGFFVGDGETVQLTALLTAYDVAGG
jgi:hypothetical protein